MALPGVAAETDLQAAAVMASRRSAATEAPGGGWGVRVANQVMVAAVVMVACQVEVAISLEAASGWVVACVVATVAGMVAGTSADKVALGQLALALPETLLCVTMECGDVPPSTWDQSSVGLKSVSTRS